MTLDEKQSATDTLTNLLVEMNHNGEFLVSMVTDSNGFPIVYAAREDFDTERLSATISMVKKTISQNEKRLGISAAKEISIVDSDGLFLICRSFSARTHELTLAVLMTNRHQAYRRLTTHTINEVSRVWSRHWK